MGRITRNIIITIVVLGLLFLVAKPKLEFLFESQSAPVNPAFSGGFKLPVSARIIKPQRLDNKIKVIGSIIANESLELKTEVDGLITEINFIEGQEVEKGQLLISLRDDELRAQLDKLGHNRNLYREIETRQRRLLEKDAISQEEYDIALNTLNTTVSDINVVKSQLIKTKIYAPFDGIIGLRYVSMGSYVTPSTIIANFYNIDQAKIDFAIPGRYSQQVKVGDHIKFTIESSPEPFNGKVYAIEPKIDPATRTLKMRAICPNPQGKLLPGQFAKIEFILNTIENAIMAPTEAVVPELTGHKVYIKKNGKVESASVKIGIRTETELEITSGLNPEDTLITSGILQVRPGSEVEITSYN